jgi:hypothetical protein
VEGGSREGGKKGYCAVKWQTDGTIYRPRLSKKLTFVTRHATKSLDMQQITPFKNKIYRFVVGGNHIYTINGYHTKQLTLLL